MKGQRLEIYGKRAAALGVTIATIPMLSAGTSARAGSHAMDMPDDMVATGLVLPPMDAANGRMLFATTGCVVCHSVNGVGGVDAPMLDAKFMAQPMNTFDFAANMWRGAETMVMMQREKLGYVIQLFGQELADVIAFVHDPEEQSRFSTNDIPDDIQELMEHAKAEDLGVAHD